MQLHSLRKYDDKAEPLLLINDRESFTEATDVTTHMDFLSVKAPSSTHSTASTRTTITALSHSTTSPYHILDAIIRYTPAWTPKELHPCVNIAFGLLLLMSIIVIPVFVMTNLCIVDLCELKSLLQMTYHLVFMISNLSRLRFFVFDFKFQVWNNFEKYRLSPYSASLVYVPLPPCKIYLLLCMLLFTSAPQLIAEYYITTYEYFSEGIKIDVGVVVCLVRFYTAVLPQSLMTVVCYLYLKYFTHDMQHFIWKYDILNGSQFMFDAFHRRNRKHRPGRSLGSKLSNASAITKQSGNGHDTDTDIEIETEIEIDKGIAESDNGNGNGNHNDRQKDDIRDLCAIIDEYSAFHHRMHHEIGSLKLWLNIELVWCVVNFWFFLNYLYDNGHIRHGQQNHWEHEYYIEHLLQALFMFASLLIQLIVVFHCAIELNANTIAVLKTNVERNIQHWIAQQTELFYKRYNNGHTYVMGSANVAQRTQQQQHQHLRDNEEIKLRLEVYRRLNELLYTHPCEFTIFHFTVSWHNLLVFVVAFFCGKWLAVFLDSFGDITQ